MSLDGSSASADAAMDAADSMVDPDTGTRDAAVLDAATADASAADAASLDAGVDGALADAGTDGGAPQRIAAIIGPTYRGSLNNSVACSETYASIGFAPVDDTNTYPLFLYFVGTDFLGNDPSARHDSEAPMAVTEAMARRGFVALSVQYDNSALAWQSDHVNQMRCLFNRTLMNSLITRACALPRVSCAKGIATWGHSQGGYLAVNAHDEEPRVRAAWATGYGGDGSPTLSKNKLRVVNGEADVPNGTAVTLNTILGFNQLMCTNASTCLQADGSGWIIVRKDDLADPMSSSADHCWFDRTSCSATSLRLEPNWVDPSSTAAFALSSNADWLAQAATTP